VPIERMSRLHGPARVASSLPCNTPVLYGATGKHVGAEERKTSMTQATRITGPAGLVLIGLCVLGAACGSSPSASDGGPPGSGRGDTVEIPAVEVVQAREGVVPLRERLTGTVRASGEVAIYPQVSGPVIEVLAQNGDRVEKGQPLVRIQAAGARAQLSQAQSSVTAAEAQLQQMRARAKELQAEYERNRELGSRGLVPLNTVESLRSHSEAATAAAESAAAQLQVARSTVAEQRDVQAQTTVRAPISGSIGQRNVEVGMRVDTGTPLFIIGRLDNMRVEVPVAQEVLTRLKPGQRVELRVGSSAAQPIEAAVSRISPFLEAGSFSAEVEIDVPNASGALVPGMFVTVDIYYGESAATTLVPASALYEEPSSGVRGVYIASTPPAETPASGSWADGDMLPAPVPVTFHQVDIVAEAAQTVGVSDVKPGEWVVVIGQHLLAAQANRAAAPEARLRRMAWEKIMELQHLQREDLLEEYLKRQPRLGSEDS
jgi:HlyD family secretion protein